jgi:hypothetical protein
MTPMPGRVTLRVGPPIGEDEVAALDVDALTARARAEVARLAELPLADETRRR